jgi:hypothetical protein
MSSGSPPALRSSKCANGTRFNTERMFLMNAERRTMRKLLTFIVVAMAIGWYVSTSSKSPTAEPAEPSCKSDWRKCADNRDMADNYGGWSIARYACKQAANEQAKYGTPRWPWYVFGAFFPGTDYLTTGLGVLIERDAQFSNGFGAMVNNVKVKCFYNLETKKVASVSIDMP